MWGHPKAVFMGDWAEGLINRSCEAEVIYIISLTRPEINDSLLYMSFIKLNLLLLFSSLIVYVHTHSNSPGAWNLIQCECVWLWWRWSGTDRKRETEMEGCNLCACEYCGRESHGTVFKWAEPAQSIKLKVSMSTESMLSSGWEYRPVRTAQTANNPQTSQQNSTIKPPVSKDWRYPVCVTLSFMSSLLGSGRTLWFRYI